MSDATIPGNALFYANPEFCRATGYARGEVLGHNCRFLQGPKTEPQSVAVIQDSLRRGVDCQVKLTNYRRDGHAFQNLLVMRAVHDSNGVCRFFVSLQLDVSEENPVALKKKATKLTKLIQLLPTTLSTSKPVATPSTANTP